MTRSPHSILGVPPDATADEIRAARRELARRHHPDAGGDADDMQRINVAAGLALRMIRTPEANGRTGPSTSPKSSAPADSGFWVGQTSDIPSFTVEALPAEAFEALLLVSAELGEVCDDDPPYGLLAKLDAPVGCWCRLEVVPDAGASSVGLSITALEGERLPSIVGVRNAWIDALNALDWSVL